MKKHLSLLFTVTLLCSCYTKQVVYMSDYLNKYVGLSENELLLNMGPADTIQPDGKGGKILTYLSSSLSTRGVSLPYNNLSGASRYYQTTTQNSTHVSFYIDQTSNKVYAYNTNLPKEIVTQKTKPGFIVGSAVLGAAIGVYLGTQSGK